MKRGFPFPTLLCLLLLLAITTTGIAQKQQPNDRRNFKPNVTNRNKTVITAAMRTLSTTAVTYYVNDNSQTGDHYTFAVGNDANPGTANLPFATLTKAINAASPGDIIYVDAGTFREDVVVDKNNISIRGSNYLTNPNGGGRSAESVIQPATSNADYNPPSNYSIVIYLDGNVNDVTIDGFTIDGDNDTITTPTDSVYNGVHIDASEAIAAYGQPSNIFIKNNIVKNVNYTGIDIFPTYNSPAVLGGAISNNKFDNILGRYAVGILIYNNFYADINNNVLTRQHVGIQTGNFYLAKPTAGNPSISNNSVSSNAIGIWHNLIYSGAATFDILNNTLTTYNNAPDNTGLEVSSIAGSVEVNVNGNNVNSARVGVNLWNCPTTGTVTVRGGTLTNCKVGVFPNNFDGYPDPNNQAASSAYALNGITFTNCDTAIWVRDNILNTNGATVALNINSLTSNVSGTGIGILIEGDGASASLSGSSPINFSTSLSKYIRYISNGNGVPTGNINATAALFGSTTGAALSLAQLFAIEDKTDHKIDRADVGFVTIKAGNDYVTPNSFDAPATTTPKLQRGVDAASATWTVNVQAGTYADNVSVNKSLTVLGPNATVNPNSGSRVAEAIVVPATNNASGRIFDVTADNVTIKGFTVDGDNTTISGGYLANGADVNAGFGIACGDDPSVNGNNNLLVENNIIQNIGSSSGFNAAFYGSGSQSGARNGNSIRNNKIDNSVLWGIVVESNFYTDVLDNVITHTGRGIQFDNTWIGGTATPTIANNNVKYYRRGILVNLRYLTASPVNVNNNTISTETAGTNEGGGTGAAAINRGLLVWSIDAAAGNITLQDNNISNAYYGEELWNNAPGKVTQTGGTLSNNTYGIYVPTNQEAYLNAGYGSHAVISQVTINNSIADGVWIADNSASNNVANITLTNTFITGGVNSIRVTGADVNATINNNSLTGNSAKGIDASGYTGTTPLNATCNWYGSADNTVVSSKVSGNVSYVPYLTNGTDSDPATQGFQPVAGACGGPTELYVNDASTSGDVYTTAVGNDGNPGTPGAPYATIGKAVTVALPGTTIYVDAGTYQEQVVISKSLNIVGAGRSGASTTKILSPNTLVAQAAANGASRAIVFATGTGKVINIKKVLIDGNHVGGTRFYGVHYDEASGRLDSSRITGMRNVPYDNEQYSGGVLANHLWDAAKPQVVTINYNIIDDYGKAGVVVNELNTRGIITNNTITGQNVKGVNAQNGIQIAFGASGMVSGNTISNNLYNDPTNTYIATGILLYGVGVDFAGATTDSTTIVNGNQITNNDAGLYTEADPGSYGPNKNLTEGPNTYTANYIHVSVNTPAAVPNAANVYDKRVDNPAQTNTVFGYIQKAVDYAAAGNTLNISGHTFTEQVEVPKNLTLHGAGSGVTIIKSPALLPLSYTTSSNTNKPVVYVHDASNIVIENLTVDGAGMGNANNRLQGIAYRNAGGTIQNSEVKDVRNTPADGAQAGVAIFAQADNGTARTLNISGNTLTGFQKNGTVLSGADLTVTVNNNTITGAGPIDYIAQNAVQLGYGAKGSITSNTISSLSYSPGTTVAAGILIINAGGTVTATSNTITNAQAGIYYYGTDGLINNNNVTYTAAGMGTTPDWYAITVNDNITSVVANTINGGGKGTGIEADYIAGQNTRLTATNNFVDNTKDAFVVYPDGSGGTAQVSINENSITNADTAIYNYGAINVNATCNWYGTTDNSVIAPKIVGPVTYVPYLLNGTDNDPAMTGFQAVPGSCTGPTQFFVNDTKTTNDVYTFGTGSDANPGTKEQPFRTINKALSLASTGDAIYVDGGMYPENVVVNKKVKLYGRDTAQSVASRFAAFTSNKADTTLESVITAPRATPNNNPGANDLVRVQTDSVVIDGFTLDGNNPNFSTGGLLADDGTRINARRGITNIDSADGFNPINAVSIRHNIIQNVSQRGVSLNNGGPVSVNNSIRNNLFRSFGWDQSTGGQAVILVANAYADITNNIIDVPHDQIGLHLQNFYANGSSTWSGNKVTVGQDAFGIHANLFYAPAATLNITGNTVNAASGVTGASDFTWGINTWSVLVGSTVNILNDTVGSAGGQFARGINLWNLPTTNTVSVTGGTVARSVTGIQLDNVDPYYGGGASTTVNVSNVTVAAATTNVLARADVLSMPPYYADNTVTGSSTINLSNATLSNATNGVVAAAPAASAPYIARVQFNTPASGITGSTVPVLINGDDAQVQAGAVNITVTPTGANNAIQFQGMNASSIANLILAGGLNINLNNNAAARAFASPSGSVVEVANAWTAPTPTASGAPNSVLVNGQLWFTNGILNSGGGSIEFGQTAANIMNGPHQEKNSSYLLGQARMLPRAVGSGAIDMLGVVLPDATGENNADVGNLTIGRTTTVGAINPPFPGNASIKTVWQIDPSNVNASRNNVRFRYLDALKNSQNPNNIFAYRYTSGNWIKISASLTSTQSGDIYTTSLFGTPGFSPWTLSSNITPATPDLTPTLTILNSTYSTSTQARNLVLNVNEVGGSATGSPVTVQIIKSTRFTYTFDPTISTINVGGPQAVNNTDWEVVSDDGSQLQLRTKSGVVINANSLSRIGLTITKNGNDDSNAGINQFFIIQPGSGGEMNSTNNIVIRTFTISL